MKLTEIHFNLNSRSEILKAEKQKFKLEFLGYNLINTQVNTITGNTILTYKKP